jgi:hypothetical protein
MGLPEVVAPEQGQPHVGRVLVGNDSITPVEARAYAKILVERANFAEKQGTQVIYDFQRCELSSRGLAVILNTAWEGTFTTLAVALLRDVLDDQQPVEAIVMATVDGSEPAYRGRVVSVTDQHILFEDSVTVDVQAVTGVCVVD